MTRLLPLLAAALLACTLGKKIVRTTTKERR